MQILDSDFEKYLVVYSCIEQAYYKSKNTGKTLTSEEVWSQKKSVKETQGTSFIPIIFDHGDDIESVPGHMELFQIHWKPEK